MGQAKLKREQEEERQRAEAQRRKEERERFNTPRGRRGWAAKVVTLQDQAGSELKLEIDRDGTPYHHAPGMPRTRVTDPVLLAVVHELLHPKPAELAPAEDAAA